MQFFMNPLVSLLWNETEDGSQDPPQPLHPPAGRLERIVWFLNSVCTPGVVMVGLLLNIACCSTMRGSRLVAQTYAPYFIWLAVSDSAFLVSLLIVWSTSVGLTDLYTSDGWCLTVTYVSGVSAFLAPWFHVGLATDRFLVTVCSHRSTPRCSSLRSHVVCLTLFLVAVPAYLNSSLIYGVVETRFGRLCVALPRFISIVQVLAELELLFTVIIPSTAIIGLVTATALYLSTNCTAAAARRRKPGSRTTTRLESGFYDRGSPCGLLETSAGPSAGDDHFGQPVVVPPTPTRRLDPSMSLLEVSPGSASSIRLPSVSVDVRPTVSVVLSTVAFLLLSLPAQLLQSWVMLSSMSAAAETTFQVSQQVILVQHLLLSIWYVRFGCSFPLQLALNPRVHAQLSMTLKRTFRFPLKRGSSDFTADSF